MGEGVGSSVGAWLGSSVVVVVVVVSGALVVSSPQMGVSPNSGGLVGAISHAIIFFIYLTEFSLFRHTTLSE